MKTKFWRKTYLLTLSLFLVFMLAALCAYTIIVYNSDMSSEADAARAEAEKLAGIYEDNIKSRYQYKTDHGYVTYVEDEEMQQEMRFISSVYLSQNSMIEFVLPNGRTLYSTFPSE